MNIDFNIIDNFKGKKILVIGDIMMDKYVLGDVNRISPEAPVQVLHVNEENFVLGGAGNAVNNLVSLGANVSVIGVVGGDSAGVDIKKELERLNVDTQWVIVHPSKPSIQKIRVVSKEHNHQLLRIDYEDTNAVEQDLIYPVLEQVKQNIQNFDAVVISDYSKGMLNESLAQNIISQAKMFNKPVIVDGKPANTRFFRGCTVITPNKKEAGEMANMKIYDDISLNAAGNKISNNLDCSVLITKGAQGMSLFEKDKESLSMPAVSRKMDVVRGIRDVCGAGDTVVSALALALAAGSTIWEGAIIANHAAGIVVGKVGTATVSPEELKQNDENSDNISSLLAEGMDVNNKMIESQLEKIKQLTDLLVDVYKKGNKVLVFGNGGSASDAQHLVGELVGRFKMERKGLPALSLNSEIATMTAVANDYGYESVFERQVEALTQPGDLVIGITTSGNSPNILKAISKAKEIGATTIGLTGATGDKLLEATDLCIKVPSENTPRIQEAHGVIIHILCELLEKKHFGNE